MIIQKINHIFVNKVINVQKQDNCQQTLAPWLLVEKHLANGRFTDTVVGYRNHGGLGQCYKTVFVRNLRTFVIRWSVCPWKVLSA